MARAKLRFIMGCPGLKSSYRGKGLLEIDLNLDLSQYIF